jgi:hypothetical protein
MENLLYLLRYFRVVSPVPVLMTGSLAVATVAGMAVVLVAGTPDASVLVPIVVLQAFSAATGFSASARRGYFDLLLARGEPRIRIAAVQWLTAITPGLVSWVGLAIVTALARRETVNPMLASGTMTALLMASTIPWAVTVALPRFSGAIGWLLVVSMGPMGGVAWPVPVREVLFPISMLGHSIGGRLDILVPALALCTLSFAGGLLWVHRADIPLEAAQ